MNRSFRFFLFVLLSILLLLIVDIVQAAVELISFTAEKDITNLKITLYWETGSELNFAGFYIQRSLTSNMDYERIFCANQESEFISSPGDGSGHQYSCDDTNVDIGTQYYYRLEMVDLDGTTDFSEIVPAILEDNPTSTPTITLTGTSNNTSPTVTRTATPTRTKTRRPSPTVTRTPSPYHVVTYTSAPHPSSTLTKTPTQTNTPTATPTATTTLIPLPSLVLLFPIHTHTPTFTPTTTQTPSPLPPTPTLTPEYETHIPLRISFLGGIIALLWISLAGFLYTYFRRVSSA